MEQLRQAIEELYYFEFVVDDLPIRGFVGYTSGEPGVSGVSGAVGVLDPRKVVILCSDLISCHPVYLTHSSVSILASLEQSGARHRFL